LGCQPFPRQLLRFRNLPADKFAVGFSRRPMAGSSPCAPDRLNTHGAHMVLRHASVGFIEFAEPVLREGFVLVSGQAQPLYSISPDPPVRRSSASNAQIQLRARSALLGSCADQR